MSCAQDPNSKDPMGNTAIHRAAANGHLNCLQRLMKKGGDVNQEDAAGCTVLHVAARNGHIGKLLQTCNLSTTMVAQNVGTNQFFVYKRRLMVGQSQGCFKMGHLVLI